MSLLLGIDIGTTGVRAAVFKDSGVLVGGAAVSCLPETPHEGWAEADPRLWWNAVRRALEDLKNSARVTLADIAAVSVVGQAPTAVLVDGNGAPVRPAMLWLDTRAGKEGKTLETHAYYLGPKLAWLARHEPDALASTKYVLQSHAFIAFKLTGEAATDPSTAALCAPFFDVATKQWLQDACSKAGISPKLLPPVRHAHEVLGTVSEQAARETGLKAGTPVAVGGGDFAAATLGAGVLHEGEACLMLGTAGNLLVPRTTPGSDPRLIHAHHVGVDTWLSLGGTLSGGAQEWLRHALVRGSTTDDTAVRAALPGFDALDGDAARVPDGADGLLFMPYLNGERTPIWDLEARGAYVGLGARHGRGHLWRALLEGIALSFVDCQAALEEGGVRLREVVAANGGGKSALFRQILADALGVPLDYAQGAGGTVAGAAILAGLAGGVLADPNVSKEWRGALVRQHPDPAKTARYRELLAIRRRAYEGLRDVFPALSRTAHAK